MSEPTDAKPPMPDVPHVGYVNSTGDRTLPENPPIIRGDREPLQQKSDDKLVVKQEPTGRLTNPSVKRP